MQINLQKRSSHPQHSVIFRERSWIKWNKQLKFIKAITIFCYYYVLYYLIYQICNVNGYRYREIYICTSFSYFYQHYFFIIRERMCSSLYVFSKWCLSFLKHPVTDHYFLEFFTRILENLYHCEDHCPHLKRNKEVH